MGVLKMVRDINSDETYEAMLASSQKAPVFLFKHSTRCHISSTAWEEFQSYAQSGKIACYRLLVVEDRHLSNQVAETSEVIHQSPQAILFQGGRAVWNASHYDITRKNLETALSNSEKNQ